MTPSNPSNSQPLIYRIMDALGVTHLVACINHTHEQSEVEGLAAALAAKANTADVDTALVAKQDALTFDTTPTAYSNNPVTSGGVYSAINNKMNISRDSLDSVVGIREVHTAQDEEFDEAYIIGDDRIMLGLGDQASNKKIYINMSNAANLERALADPDTTPTANSEKFVTSGGVKVALDGKQDALTFDTTPTAGSNNPVTSGGIKTAIGKCVPFNAFAKFTYEDGKLTAISEGDEMFASFPVDAINRSYTCPMVLELTKTNNGYTIMQFETLGSMYLVVSADLKNFDIYVMIGESVFHNSGLTTTDQQGLHFGEWDSSDVFTTVGNIFA